MHLSVVYIRRAVGLRLVPGGSGGS
jgi:hypothetical protein